MLVPWLLQLCQGVTLWLVQEADKEEGKKTLTPVVKKQKRNEEEDTTSPLYHLRTCPQQPQRLPTESHFLHVPSVSHSSSLGSKSLPHYPLGTNYSTRTLVRINLLMDFHSPHVELFQLLNTNLLQDSEYLNSTTGFILAGDRVTSKMIRVFLVPNPFSYPY